MNSNQILCFLEAAKEMNFSKAALNLYISQPNLSRTISTLEKELNTQLFSRHPNKTLSLTDSGKVYFDAFSKCEVILNDAKTKCNSTLNFKKAIRIGYVSGWNISDYIINKIDDFNAIHTDVSIDLECYHITELSQKMLSKEIDACITIENAVLGAKPLNCKFIYKLPRVLIYPNSLFLNVRDEISPKDFKNQTFLYFENSLRRNLEHELITQFFKDKYMPKLKYVPNQETMISLVENGKAVAVMDMWSQPIYSTKISWVPFPGHHNIVLAWNNPNTSDTIYDLYKFLMQKK